MFYSNPMYNKKNTEEGTGWSKNNLGNWILAEFQLQNKKHIIIAACPRTDWQDAVIISE